MGYAIHLDTMVAKDFTIIQSQQLFILTGCVCKTANRVWCILNNRYKYKMPTMK